MCKRSYSYLTFEPRLKPAKEHVLSILGALTFPRVACGDLRWPCSEVCGLRRSLAPLDFLRRTLADLGLPQVALDDLGWHKVCLSVMRETNKRKKSLFFSIVTHFHSLRSRRYLEEIFLPVSRTFLDSPGLGKTRKRKKRSSKKNNT